MLRDVWINVVQLVRIKHLIYFAYHSMSVLWSTRSERQKIESDPGFTEVGSIQIIKPSFHTKLTIVLVGQKSQKRGNKKKTT